MAGIAAVLAGFAGFAGFGTAALTAVASPAARPAFTHAAGGTEYRFGKFTAKPVTGTSYYEMVVDGNGSFCISTNGHNTQGSDVVLEGCSTTDSNDLWAVGFWSGGSWDGYAYIYSDASTSMCLDDASGAENIRLPLHSCGEVGGMSWYFTATNQPSSGYCIWENAIAASQLQEPVDITDDFNDLYDGAWVVIQYDSNYIDGGTGWEVQQQWGGLYDWGGGCISG